MGYKNSSQLNVSIHATLAGGDRMPLRSYTSRRQFLSTPPSRVATAWDMTYDYWVQGFYPRHPRGWRQALGFVADKYKRVSIHATLAGGDAYKAEVPYPLSGFLSTPPSRVATKNIYKIDKYKEVSIHATLAGGDEKMPLIVFQTLLFLSTPPSRVATNGILALAGIEDVSIHATLAGGDITVKALQQGRSVSIHATLAGGDVGRARNDSLVSVSIHATLAGGDFTYSSNSLSLMRFLSTPPSRVATILEQFRIDCIRGFYPRHPRGWRQIPLAASVWYRSVSIHATLAGGDLLGDADKAQEVLFLSTPPSRVAT